MAGRKVKIEFTDEDGGIYNISMTGSITKDKVERIMEMVELLAPTSEKTLNLPNNNTSFSKLYQLIETKFPLGNFFSTDILEAYEDEYKNPIRLNTISTYLQRFSEKGVLTRQHTSSGWVYRRSKI